MRSLKPISLILVIIMLFSFVSCEGTYNGPTNPGGSSQVCYHRDADANGYCDDCGKDMSDGGDTVDQPELNDDPTDDFTVTVKINGQNYSPRININVYWSDGFSIHAAPLSKQGVARIDGLDGDYNVTLSAVPNEYTYDPNNNPTTNDNRNIVIELQPINRLSGSGTGIYDCYKFSKLGVYSAVITEKCDKGADSGGGVFFEFAPQTNGTYTIESWIDVSADNINPYIDVYGGNPQYKWYSKTTDDGGAVGSYTINFVHTVEIADENISTSGGGQATYTFAVKAESKNGKYPITVTFAVKRNGGFEYGSNRYEKSTAVSTFDFSNFNKADHEYDDNYYKISYPEYLLEGTTNVYVLDKSRFKLGSDGFYHVYDEEKYASTDGFGPILYAHVKSACRFLNTSFYNIEYVDETTTHNAALTVGGVNYKHFIEGHDRLATLGLIDGGSYYCTPTCPCHQGKPKTDWLCAEGCMQCEKNCRNCPEELIGFKGYQYYSNSDGLAPVTEELKEFLTRFSAAHRYFYDGEGYMETNDTRPLQAYADSDWLFACAYYEEK